MPRRQFDDHFEEERPEWTKRKHAILDRYVVAAAMKMRRIGGSVALIDGYAGANAYGPEATGSTMILVQAARKVRLQGNAVKVYACEPDPGRFESLCENLRDDVDSGLLRPFSSPHSSSLPTIMREIGDTPAFVFLDPQTVSQMTLADDILPWTNRKKTDVLGVFMSGQACRCVGQLVNSGPDQKVHPEAYLGSDWAGGTSEHAAVRIFFEALGTAKRFKGLYPLRKLAPLRSAYGIFGLSDHQDGFWLLSNAVAKDHNLLDDFDHDRLKETSLFAETDRETAQKEAFNQLVSIAAPTIHANPDLRGADLASHLFNKGIGISELFGRFVERDFTTAAYYVLGLQDRRGRG